MDLLRSTPVRLCHGLGNSHTFLGSWESLEMKIHSIIPSIMKKLVLDDRAFILRNRLLIHNFNKIELHSVKNKVGSLVTKLFLSFLRFGINKDCNVSRSYPLDNTEVLKRIGINYKPFPKSLLLTSAFDLDADV